MQINEASKPAARSEQLILVDEHNRAIGHAEKWSVHREARLHRAFSIFLVDAEGRLLLQQRSREKYHSGGLWANSCCGHPRPGEIAADAAVRRLREEMGIECPLIQAGTVSYSVDVGDGLREDEFNHVFVGLFTGDATPDPAEVSAWRWMTPRTLGETRAGAPHEFTPWFGLVFDRLHQWLQGKPAQLPAPVLAAWLAAP